LKSAAGKEGKEDQDKLLPHVQRLVKMDFTYLWIIFSLFLSCADAVKGKRDKKYNNLIVFFFAG
jgi:hypothetical protein